MLCSVHHKLALRLLVVSPLALPTALADTSDVPSYCLRVTTSNIATCDGFLIVDVFRADGSQSRVSPGDVDLRLGAEVVKDCDFADISRVEFSAPKPDGWCGTFEYSSDGGATFFSLKCTSGCTFNVAPNYCKNANECTDNRCSEFVIADGDGNGYGGADCIDGKVCTLEAGAASAAECATRTKTWPPVAGEAEDGGGSMIMGAIVGAGVGIMLLLFALVSAKRNHQKLSEQQPGGTNIIGSTAHVQKTNQMLTHQLQQQQQQPPPQNTNVITLSTLREPAADNTGSDMNCRLCTECAASLPSNVKFCPACGAKAD